MFVLNSMNIINNLQETFLLRIQVFKHNYGGSIGNLLFVWKVPDGPLDQTRQHRCVNEVQKLIPKFESRAIAAIFREKFSKITGITPVVRSKKLEKYLSTYCFSCFPIFQLF